MFSIPQQYHIGRGDDSVHDEDNNCDSAVSYFNDLYNNSFDTTCLNNVMVQLPLFLSAKSVPVKIAEESRYILILSAKYHTKAAGVFLIFLPILQFLFGDLLTRDLKLVPNPQSVYVGIYGVLTHDGHVTQNAAVYLASYLVFSRSEMFSKYSFL